MLDLADFHSGSVAALDRCYREHFDDVRAAVERVLHGADEETVIHNVFYRLVSDSALRANFRGGNFAAWIRTVARNEAIDYWRRHRREEAMGDEPDANASKEHDPDAKILVDRFRVQLPEKLRGVFEARFLRQLSQREAAAALGMQRTTLVYQEQQVREALKAFLLEDEP
jgi:RNA polymerase sigma-70 factor (ECF subfamily)